MRLINARTGELKEFNEDERPPYAILSHTWGTKRDEITLQQAAKYHKRIKKHRYRTAVSSRSGYDKIKGCCRQALIDGINWVWVDTCCIDKTSSTELSEAINSMFHWYRQADVCYVHLSDVFTSDEDFSEVGSAFRASRWFTRGWTLQELLAPHQIRFFTKDWDLIGQLTEGSRLVEVVSEITSIPPGFLEGQNLLLANIAEKMSWAATRSTTREEDTAYCLLGIFDVNMPLLYGEGHKAFRRLQEEIMKQTFDHTILAWGILPWHEGYSECQEKDSAFFAESPIDFRDCGSLVRSRPRIWKHHETPYQMANRGLHIELPLRRISSGRWLAKLSCSDWKQPCARMDIILRMKGDRFIRTSRMLIAEDDSLDEAVEKYSIQSLILDDHIDKFRFLEYVITIDIPPEYRCEVKYLGPGFKAKSDRLRRSHNSLRISYPQSLQPAGMDKKRRRRLSSFSEGLIRTVTRSSLAQPSSGPGSTRFQLQLTSTADSRRSCLICLDHTSEYPFEFYLSRIPEPMPQDWPIPISEELANSSSFERLEVDGTILSIKVLREWEFGEDILVKIEEGTETTSLKTLLSSYLEHNDTNSHLLPLTLDILTRNFWPIFTILLLLLCLPYPQTRPLAWTATLVPLLAPVRRRRAVGDPGLEARERWAVPAGVVLTGVVSLVGLGALNLQGELEVPGCKCQRPGLSEIYERGGID